MKFWGRGIVMYLTITALLYGTQAIWTSRSYDVAVGSTGHATTATFLALEGGGTPGGGGGATPSR